LRAAQATCGVLRLYVVSLNKSALASAPAQIVTVVLTGFYDVLGLRELETFYGDEYGAHQMTKAWQNVRVLVACGSGCRAPDCCNIVVLRSAWDCRM
jgi:hypothetical protein